MTTPTPEADVNQIIRHTWEAFRGYNAASNPLDNAHALISLTDHMHSLVRLHPNYDADSDLILQPE